MGVFNGALQGARLYNAHVLIEEEAPETGGGGASVGKAGSGALQMARAVPLTIGGRSHRTKKRKRTGWGNKR